MGWGRGGEGEFGNGVSVADEVAVGAIPRPVAMTVPTL